MVTCMRLGGLYREGRLYVVRKEFSRTDALEREKVSKKITRHLKTKTGVGKTIGKPFKTWWPLAKTLGKQGSLEHQNEDPRILPGA